MTEQPRNWDREMAEIDRAIAKAPATPPTAGTGPGTVPSPAPKRLVALTWFWVGLAVVLAIGLTFWPYDKSCGLRLIFYIGGAGIVVLIGFLGALASWSHRRGLAMVLSLLAIVWAGVMAAREVLPRVGYAKQSLAWTCPSPPAAAPAPQPTGN